MFLKNVFSFVQTLFLILKCVIIVEPLFDV
jgi:hypothetical protein